MQLPYLPSSSFDFLIFVVLTLTFPLHPFFISVPGRLFLLLLLLLILLFLLPLLPFSASPSPFSFSSFSFSFSAAPDVGGASIESGSSLVKGVVAPLVLASQLQGAVIHGAPGGHGALPGRASAGGRLLEDGVKGSAGRGSTAVEGNAALSFGVDGRTTTTTTSTTTAQEGELEGRRREAGIWRYILCFSLWCDNYYEVRGTYYVVRSK